MEGPLLVLPQTADGALGPPRRGLGKLGLTRPLADATIAPTRKFGFREFVAKLEVPTGRDFEEN